MYGTFSLYQQSPTSAHKYKNTASNQIASVFFGTTIHTGMLWGKFTTTCKYLLLPAGEFYSVHEMCPESITSIRNVIQWKQMDT